MEHILQDNIVIRLPIKIDYHVLEAYLQEKFIGENIEDYAKITDVSLYKSLKEKYDIALELEFKMLTSLFRNREGSIILHASLNFDHINQEITVKDYKLQGNSESWLMNNSFQAMANTFFHKKIKEKMKFQLRPHIEKQLLSLNRNLENPLEAAGGIFLSGYLKDFVIQKIIPGDNLVLIFIEIEGNALVDIKKIDF